MQFIDDPQTGAMSKLLVQEQFHWPDVCQIRKCCSLLVELEGRRVCDAGLIRVKFDSLGLGLGFPLECSDSRPNVSAPSQR